jgi:hypothetical protein
MLLVLSVCVFCISIGHIYKKIKIAHALTLTLIITITIGSLMLPLLPAPLKHTKSRSIIHYPRWWCGFHVSCFMFHVSCFMWVVCVLCALCSRSRSQQQQFTLEMELELELELELKSKFNEFNY